MITYLVFVCLSIAVVGAVLIAIVVDRMLTNNAEFSLFYCLLVLFIAACTLCVEYKVCSVINEYLAKS